MNSESTPRLEPATSQDEEECARLQEEELEALISVLGEDAVKTQPSSPGSGPDRVATGGTRLSISIQIDLGEPKPALLARKPRTSGSPRPNHKSSRANGPGAAAPGRNASDGRGKRARGRGDGNSDGNESSAQPTQPVLPQSGMLRPATPPPLPLSLQYMLPFTIEARLPPSYPLHSPPKLAVRCIWAPRARVRQAEAMLGAIWSELRAECLVVCADWMKHDWIQGAAAAGPIPLEVPSAAADGLGEQLFADRLIHHDRLMRGDAFDRNTFFCPICLENRKGAKCFELSGCGHVFCSGCLVDYFSMMITEGVARSVHCCDPGCLAARAEAPADTPVSALPGSVSRDELEALVGRNLADRHRWLLQKQAAEADPTVAFCPICSCVVPRDLLAPETDKMRLCPSPRCGLAFCVLCRRTWHGVNPCALPQSNMIVERYLATDDEGRALLEARYGRKNVLALVRTFEEERANAAWKEEHTTACVSCGVLVEKSAGCNHMTCARCSSHFCFRCGSRLDPSNPYAHFSNPGGSCLNRLFDPEASRGLEVVDMAELFFVEE